MRVRKSTQLHTSIDAQAHLDLLFPTQISRQGLGNKNFNANLSKKERRNLTALAAKRTLDEAHIMHAHGLAMQGNWLQWTESSVPFDLSWKNLIYGPGAHLLKWVLNASVNWVKTPDLLRLWGKCTGASCPLNCGSAQCTLHHILSGCKTALFDGRYRWRHDSVLNCLYVPISDRVALVNRVLIPNTIPPISENFVKAGKSKLCCRRKRACELDGATDWVCLVDLEQKLVFPAEVWCTSQRPDIVIWSRSLHKVIIIELTCPAEEGIANAAQRKKARYSQLRTDIETQSVKWTAVVMTIEVGARGFVAKSLLTCLRRLGLENRAISRLCKDVSLISAKCSYAIYLAYTNPIWDNRELLHVARSVSTSTAPLGRNHS